MDDIFQKKKRKRPLARVAGILFAVLAGVSLVEAIRAAPLEVGGGVELGGVEAILYRLAATFFCAALAIWLLRGNAIRRQGEAGDRLLR